jgi:hypothetical protein
MSVSRLLPFTAPPPMERKAEAVAEISELYRGYEEAVERIKQDERVIQRLQDRLQLLEDQLKTEQLERRVLERKLIRLAANQRNISRIAQDGDEIMRSVQEWNEADSDQNEANVREILQRASPQEGDPLPKNTL